MTWRPTPTVAAFGRVVSGGTSMVRSVVAAARQARGEARAALLARLAVLDRELLQSARRQLDERRTTQLASAAAADIAPFAARMSPEARLQATDAAFERLLRDSVGLPNLVHEP